MRAPLVFAIVSLWVLAPPVHADDGPNAAVVAAGRAPTFATRVEQATAALKTATGRDAALAHAIRGIAAYREGRYRSAVYDLGRALKGRLAIDDLLLFFEGEGLFHDGHYDTARSTYQKLIKDYEHSPWRHRAIVRLADCDLAEGRWAQAIKGLTAAIDRYPEFPYQAAAFYAIADAERERGKLTRAAGWLRRILRSYPSDPIAEVARRDLDALAAQGVKAEIESADVRYRRAYDLRRRKYFRQAIEVFDVLMAEGGVSRGIKAKAAYQRGRALFQMERFEDARAAFAALEATSSWRNLARTWRSRALERLGRLDDAATALLATGDPERPTVETLTDIGWIYFNAARYEKAAEYFGTVTRRGAGSSTKWMRAWLAYRLGEYKAAALAFKRLQAGSRQRTGRYGYWLARTLVHLGDLDAAEATYKGIISSSPLSYYAYQARARLEDLGRPLPFEPVTNEDPDTVDDDQAGPDPGERCTDEDGDKSCPPPEAVGDPTAEAAPELVERVSPVKELVDAALHPIPIDTSAAAVLYELDQGWGSSLPEIRAAYELAAMGEDQWAMWSLRAVSDSMRAASTGAAFRPLPYVDNRKDTNLGEWGRVFNDKPVVRSAAGKRFLRGGKSRRFIHLLRDAYAAIGDHYYARRYHGRDNRVVGPPESPQNNPAWRVKYPRAFRDLVEAGAATYGLDPHFIWALMTVESRYNPWAISRVGARGLMQVMPHTGGLVADRMAWRSYGPSLLSDPEVVVQMASWYFHQLLTKFNGQIPLAVASYNAGPHRVSAWLERKGHLPMDEFVEEIPYTEAREYAKKVQRYVWLYRRIYGAGGKFAGAQVIDPNFGDNINF